MRIALIIVIMLISIVPATGQELKIHCINVGWGDCTLIESPSGMKMLVDAGHYYSHSVGLMTEYLRSVDVDTIDYFVATHYHSDHIGGVNNLVDSGFVLLSAYDRNYQYPSGQFNEYLNTVESIRHTAVDGQIFDLGEGVTAEVVSVNGNGVWDPPFDNDDYENEYSVALLVNYLDFRFFVGGDITAKVESTLVTESIGQVDVYQVNHHCSYTASCQYFLDHIFNPSTPNDQVSVISCGSSAYNFPHPAPYERLDQISVVYQTEDDDGNKVDGNILIITDGYYVFVETETGVDERQTGLPNKYILSSNYPNPFNACTSIDYQINSRARVSLIIYDLLGRETQKLVDCVQQPGLYRIGWNAQNYSSGVYFYTLKVDEYTESRKMILMK